MSAPASFLSIIAAAALLALCAGGGRAGAPHGDADGGVPDSGVPDVGADAEPAD